MPVANINLSVKISSSKLFVHVLYANKISRAITGLTTLEIVTEWKCKSGETVFYYTRPIL